VLCLVVGDVTSTMECAIAPKGRIHFVGSTMIDTLLANLHRFTKPPF